jgi:hypothetical protein
MGHFGDEVDGLEGLRTPGRAQTRQGHSEGTFIIATPRSARRCSRSSAGRETEPFATIFHVAAAMTETPGAAFRPIELETTCRHRPPCVAGLTRGAEPIRNP